MNKYNKTLRYRRNHQLIFDTFEASGFFTNFAMGAVISLIIFWLNIPYTSAFKGFDFAMLVSILSYQLILRPRIYRGDIKAYYRRSYKKLKFIITNFAFVGVTSMWRFVILSGTQIYNEESLLVLYKDIYHPVTTLIVTILSLLVFYLTYYNDKYTTIREYSNSINFNIKENGMHEKDAIWRFGVEKDREYDVKEFRGTYYDYDDTNQKHKNEIIKNKKQEEERKGIRREQRRKL